MTILRTINNKVWELCENWQSKCEDSKLNLNFHQILFSFQLSSAGYRTDIVQKMFVLIFKHIAAQ